jgi:Na+-transporting NADH:ubiquinone oxidoreductase subunit F
LDVALSIHKRRVLPLFFVGLTNLFGTWLMVIYGLTQHALMAENVLDQRLNCRTVYMKPANRFSRNRLFYTMYVEEHRISATG